MKTIAQQLNIKDFPFEIKNKDGNVIYWEDSNGYWEKREHNLDGNETYLQGSDGYWEKREYNSDGYEIYLQDSNGSWSKREYDSAGNEIYYENSDGEITDNRPKDDVITLNGVKYKRVEE